MAAKKTTKKATTTSKAAQIQAGEAAVAVQAVQALKPHSILVTFAEAQSEATETFAELGGKIAEGLRQFETVTAAIAAQEQRLKETYEVEEALLQIDEVRHALETARAEASAYDEEVAAERAREEQEFNYKLNRARREAADKFEDEVAARKKAEAARREDLEKANEAREATLKAGEAELADLRALKASLPETIAKAEEKGKAIATHAAKRDFGHEAAIEKAKADAAAAVAQASIESQKAEIARLREENARLAGEVSDANKRVAEIAREAAGAAKNQQVVDQLLAAQNSQQQAGRAR